MWVVCWSLVGKHGIEPRRLWAGRIGLQGFADSFTELDFRACQTGWIGLLNQVSWLTFRIGGVENGLVTSGLSTNQLGFPKQHWIGFEAYKQCRRSLCQRALSKSACNIRLGLINCALLLGFIRPSESPNLFSRMFSSTPLQHLYSSYNSSQIT